MKTGELGALIVGAVIAVVVTGLVCWFNSRLVRRQNAPVEQTPRMHVPVANPTPGWEPPHTNSGQVATATVAAVEPLATTLTATATSPSPSPSETIKSLQMTVLSTQRDRDKLAHEAEHLRRQVQALSNELQRVEQQRVHTDTQWKTDQNRLAVSEAGLVKARQEISEIREFVLQLGATKSDEDIIDLRKP